MATMTIDDVLKILEESAGAAESLDSGEALLDLPFEDMGYDSLALIETAARIEQDYGVVIGDEEITELKTPRALLQLVNETLTEPA